MNKKPDISELLKDVSFLNWVHQSNAKDIQQWDSWIKNNPQHKDLIEEARLLSVGFSFKNAAPSNQQTNNSWTAFSDKINQTNTQVTKSPFKALAWRVAACILILACAVGAFQYFNSPPPMVVFTTDQQSTKKIKLPDGSTVQLNTQTTLSYASDWANQSTRRILLEGEAFFDIQPQVKGEKIQIQTNQLTIDVVGTAFNLNSKRALPIVSLTEGTLRLKSPLADSIVLQQGETAYLKEDLQQFHLVPDNTEYWQAWTVQKWAFGAGTELAEILQRIRETYGMDYQVSEPALLRKTASGDVSIENSAILLEALATLLDINIELVDNQLKISPNGPF